MRILGIDPGLNLTGYGCVDLAPGAMEPTLVEAGVFRLKPRTDMSFRLQQLYEDLEAVLMDLDPQHMVVEALFSHYKHVRTSILMGHARGVVLLAGQRRDVSISEMAPAEVKKAMTGNGQATKRQMQLAVMAQCSLTEVPDPPDVADAIAIAVCAGRRIAAERVCAEMRG